MGDARAQQIFAPGETAYFFAEHVHQLSLRVGPPVGQRSFQVVPNALVRIQFGRIGWQRDQMQAAGAGAKFAYGVGLVNARIVEQHEQVSRDLAQQVPEEILHFAALHIVFVEMTVQGEVLPHRTGRYSRYGGNALVPLAMPQPGRLPHRTPGLANGRGQQEAGFVEEQDVGAQPPRVFFTAGHVERFHSLMASSSRSMARRSGF